MQVYPVILVKDIAPGQEVRGTAAECKTCGVLFIGRKSAVYCSDKCRKAYDRASEGRPPKP